MLTTKLSEGKKKSSKKLEEIEYYVDISAKAVEYSEVLESDTMVLIKIKNVVNF